MTNEELYEEALEKIMELFGDTSVSKEQAIDNLKGLVSEIEILIDTLSEGAKSGTGRD